MSEELFQYCVLAAVGMLFVASVLVFERWRTRLEDEAFEAVGVRIREAERKREAGLPPSTDFLGAVPIGEETTRYACGHDGPTRFKMDFWGEPIGQGDASEKMPPKCQECLIAEIRLDLIRCCLCGYSIGPGDKVALYNYGTFRTDATKVGEGERAQFVGCLRSDCCPSGGFFGGHWTRDGFKPAFEGGGCMAAEVMRTGKTIVVND